MITILLATYNGEEYLQSQLESLAAQTCKDFRLIVSDDLSTDRTTEILNAYKTRFENGISVEIRSENSGGAKHNFLELMINRRSESEYFMLCDQDDIWRPDKIERTLKAMKTAEKAAPGRPVLVHTDLTVVDKDGKTTHSSYARLHAADYTKTALQSVLAQNCVTGCTVMYNRALAEYFTQKPSFFVMHDWWAALAASAFGVIAPLQEQTILYRQHGRNNIGARNMRSPSFKIKAILHGGGIKEALSASYSQASAFLELYGNRLSEADRRLVAAYAKIPAHKSKLKRIRQALSLHTLKSGAGRAAAQLWFI